MHRFLKQFLYSLFYLAVLGLVIYSVYKVYFPPVVAPQPCLTCDIKIESLEVIVLPLGSQTSSFLVKIKNPTSQYGLKKFDYQFRVFSRLGPPIKSISGASSLFPNEEKYIAVSNVDIYAGDIGTVKFEPLNLSWEMGSFGSRPDVVVTDTSLDDLPEFIRFSGKLVNRSDRSIGVVNVIASLNNSDGKIVTASSVGLDGLKPKSTQSFAIFLPKVQYQNYAVYIDLGSL